MERRQLLKGLAGLAACPLCFGGQAHAQHHWNYRNVDEWGGACSTGGRQSPVDITTVTRNPQMPQLQIGWARQASAIKNNGHTIEVACGGAMTRGGAQYRLLQFHFHHPSEHKINGNPFPMEVHFVHAGPGGLGVIGAFMTRGGGNETFSRIVQAMPRRPGQVAAPAGVNPWGLLPGSLRYYSYAGSLTTPTGPDCTENVNWMVLAQPIAVGANDIAAFGSVYRMNARPVKRRLTGVAASQ